MDVVVATVAGALYVGTAVWVHRDARAIGVAPGQAPGGLDLGPRGWLVGCLSLWIVMVPAYLLLRDGYLRANGRWPTTGGAPPPVVRRPRGGPIRLGSELVVEPAASSR